MEKRKQKKSQRRSGNGELLVSQLYDTYMLVIRGVMRRVWMRCLRLLQQFVSRIFKLLIELHCLTDSRWEEERYTDGVKWKFLEHKGPVFAPPYEPIPSQVKFYYDGEILFPFLHQRIYCRYLHNGSYKCQWLINTPIFVCF